MDKVLEYISSRLKQEKLRHVVHKFNSGAVMIDIWKEDKFYVVQIADERIGLSLVTEDTGFDVIPDKSYDTLEKFNIDFENIFHNAS